MVKCLIMEKKKSKQLNPGQVIIPASPNPPEPHEVDVAWILARHFRCTVEFLTPVDDYKRKSADIVMLGIEWEIKCPIGKSKYTIQEQFRRASKQAKNIIIDMRRTKLEHENIEKLMFFEVKKRPYIKKVILIDKFDKVIHVHI